MLGGGWRRFAGAGVGDGEADAGEVVGEELPVRAGKGQAEGFFFVVEGEEGVGGEPGLADCWACASPAEGG